MILVLPLPQRMSILTQMSFSTPTLLYTTYTTRALRQVRLVLLIVRGLSTPARVAIILPLDIKTLNAQIPHKVLRRGMLSALQFSRYAEPSGARMATPTLALSLIPSYSLSSETLQPDVTTDYLEKPGNLSELRRVEVIGMHLYPNF